MQVGRITFSPQWRRPFCSSSFVLLAEFSVSFKKLSRDVLTSSDCSSLSLVEFLRSFAKP